MTATRTRQKLAAKKPPGHPSRYTADLAAQICRRMSQGESLRSICRDPNMPPESTVRGWAVDDIEGFSEQYARAREFQADALFDQALEIEDAAEADLTTDKDGKRVVNHENVQRSRLRVDTRKWAAGRLAPKRDGDKMQYTGDGGGPIHVRADLSQLTDEELNALERIFGRTTDA